MNAIRKLLAMALVVAAVLSMSTLVFAAENEVDPTTCNHVVDWQEKYVFVWVDNRTCSYFLDHYGYCQLCKNFIYMADTEPTYLNHFVEEGESYCWQCHHSGCV